MPKTVLYVLYYKYHINTHLGPRPSVSLDEAGGWFHQDLIHWCRSTLIHKYIVKHSVKEMHPGLGVMKLGREFTKL